MSGTEPIGSIDFTALMLATEACAVGDLLLFDTSVGYWRVATTAIRATSLVGAQAIAMTAYGGSEVGKVKYRTAGIVPQSVTGLAVLTPSGTRKLVRTSSTGRLERIDAFTSGDDVVGVAEWDGRVHLTIGLPWAQLAGTAAPAALPDRSVQRRNEDGTFGGAAYAWISDDGTLCIGIPAAGHPTDGYVNFTATAAIKVRNALNSANLLWMRTRGALNNCADYFFFGDHQHGAALIADRIASVEAGWDGVSKWYAGAVAVSPNAFSDGSTAKGMILYDNFALGRNDDFPYGTGDILWGGGRGVFSWRKVTTTPSAVNDRLLCWFETDNSSTNHLYAKLPNGSVVDLLDGGGDEANAKTITATPSGSLAMATYGHLDVSSSGANVDLGAFVAPAAGKAKRFTVHHIFTGGCEAGIVKLVHEDVTQTAADRFYIDGEADLSVLDGETYTVTYSQARTRWVVSKGVA